MPPKGSCNQNAEYLKTQGNEFFQTQQYQPAYRKYTEAIKEDPTNAVYYANRAACSLAMKKYLDAASDARKATEIDPKYAKGWSRLATSQHKLAEYSRSADSWKSALKCLPPLDQSSATEKNLRSQFTASLAAAEQEIGKLVLDESNTIRCSIADEKMPWQRAEALEDELAAQQKLSSAFIIIQAYREFKEGVDDMKKLKKTVVGGNTGYFGNKGSLSAISNGVMCDARAFHLDSPDWTDKYNEQVVFEATASKAWVNGGATAVKEEAPRRLKREGWDSVRPALSTTVRAWIMCGFIAKSTGTFVAAIEYYSRAVDVLEWGARTWQNVPDEDRGVIFSKTFIRGTKRMKLDAMHMCLVNKVKDVDITSDDMANYARELIAETDANPPTAVELPDFRFVMSFWMYPKGDALSLLGWHYMKRGHKATTSEDAQAAYSQSADYYMEAAGSYPTDEENRILFYKVALDVYWVTPQGKKLKEMVPIFTRIDELLPDMLKIWEHSALSKGRDPQLLQALDFAKRCGEAVQSGRITMDTLVRPKEIEKSVKWKGNFVYI